MPTTGTPLANPSRPARDLVFISYSHRDRDWLERLLIFLKPYTRQNLKIWADPYIQVGDEWRRDISDGAVPHLRRRAARQLITFSLPISSTTRSCRRCSKAPQPGSIILVPIPVSASRLRGEPAGQLSVCPPAEPIRSTACRGPTATLRSSRSSRKSSQRPEKAAPDRRRDRRSARATDNGERLCSQSRSTGRIGRAARCPGAASEPSAAAGISRSC